MSASDFTYLHVHTHFSPGGGPASPCDWCRHAADMGYKAIGVADRAPLPALPALRRAARIAGITPILGIELDLALPSPGEQALQPVALYAHTEEGLHNLARLSELAYSGWPLAAQPVEWEALSRSSAGLVLILLAGNIVQSPKSVGAVREPPLQSPPVPDFGLWTLDFGLQLKSHFAQAFVGLPHSGRPGDDERAEQVARAAATLGLPTVAMPTARYPRAEDALSYHALAMARQRVGWASLPKSVGAVREPPVQNQPDPDFGLWTLDFGLYPRPPAEAAALFERWPEAVANIGRIVAMCGPVVQGLAPPDAHGDEAVLAALRARAEERISQRLGAEALTAEVRERLDAELTLIAQSGNQAAWAALARLADIAQAERIPLGAPLAGASGSGQWSVISGQWPQAGTDHWPLTTGHCPPGIEVPGNCRDKLVAALAEEYGPGTIVHPACLLEITPLAALQAARLALSTPEGQSPQLSTAFDPSPAASWEALAEAAAPGSEAPGSEGEAVRLALSLRGAPLLAGPDRGTLAFAPKPGEAGEQAWAPMLSAGEDPGAGWVPWTAEDLRELGYPSLWLRSSSALSALHTALTLAAEYPSPDFAPPVGESFAGTEWSDKAQALLKKGEVVGIPYLAAAVLKGWKGDLSPESLPALVARSLDLQERPDAHKAQPSEIAPWAAHTEDTGGALLYFDQFASVLQSAAGISLDDAAAIRLAMLNPNPGGDARERFVEGCLRSGLEDGQAGELWDALLAAAPGLVSRDAAVAWAGVALRLAYVKAAHPAAFLAAALDAAWERGGQAGLAPLVEWARRLGIALLPPDATRSQAGPVPQKQDKGWAVLWGLMLPGWDRRVAERFIEAREGTQGIASLGDLARACLAAGLSPAQLEALVRSGACDRFGGRDALLVALPDLVERARTSPDGSPPTGEIPGDGDLTPRVRHAHRAWEQRNLGIGFTDAAEMDALRRAIGDSGGLRSRLITTRDIGPANVGHSLYLVGLLHGIGEIEDPEGGQGMAAALLQDLEGEIELVAFPPNYRRHRELWTENNMVIVTARACSHPDGDGIYLLCEHLAAYHASEQEEELELDIKVTTTRRNAPVPATRLLAPQLQAANGGSRQDYPVPQQAPTQAASQARPGIQDVVLTGEAPAYHLIITLPASGDDHADIDRMIALDKLLKAHSGPDTVTLRIQYSTETADVTSAKLPHRVRYDASLEEDIRGLLGPDALALIKLAG